VLSQIARAVLQRAHPLRRGRAGRAAARADEVGDEGAPAQIAIGEGAALVVAKHEGGKAAEHRRRRGWLPGAQPAKERQAEEHADEQGPHERLAGELRNPCLEGRHARRLARAASRYCLQLKLSITGAARWLSTPVLEASLLSSSTDAMHSAAGWTSPHLPGVEVSLRAHAGPLPRFRLIPMVQVGVLVTGEALVRWGNDIWHEKPGHCMVAAPECNFRIVRRLTETASTLRVYVAPRLFDERMRRRHGPPSTGFRLRHLADPVLAEAVRDLQGGMSRAARASVLHASFDRLMERVQRLLAATSGKGNETRPEIRKALEMLQKRFADPVPLDQLTEHVGLSKFHLIRVFRDEIGVAPHAFQLQLRISRARQFLASGRSLAEVAAACGFADQAHFSRCFKTAVGYTPGAFRRLD
jgi:AraC-like DNA-binding protein